MDIEFLLAVAAFTFAASVTPGPNNLMVMASGANFGIRRTLPHFAGVIIGFQVMIWLVGAGISQLFIAYPASFVIMKIVSAIFLLYIAWKIANAAPLSSDAGEIQGSKPLTFFQAAAFQWVNPKAWAISIATLGAYSIAGETLLSIVIIAVAFLITGIPSVMIWLFLGTQLRRLLSKPWRLRAFNWTCAAILVLSLAPILASTSLTTT